VSAGALVVQRIEAPPEPIPDAPTPVTTGPIGAADEDGASSVISA